MKRKTRILENPCDTNHHNEIVPSSNINENCKVIRLQDIHEPVRVTKPHVFDITSDIIERFNISFNDIERIRLETSYYNFFELIYWVVDSVIYKNVSNSSQISTKIYED